MDTAVVGKSSSLFRALQLFFCHNKVISAGLLFDIWRPMLKEIGGMEIVVTGSLVMFQQDRLIRLLTVSDR
jgi:hypothetical protein